MTLFDDKLIRKATFNQNLTRKDFDIVEKKLGLNVIGTGKQHMIIQFKSQLEYLAFATVKDIYQSKTK